MDLATGAAREVTPHEGDAQYVPAGWTADGGFLVMTDDVGGPRHLDLVAMDLASREWKRLDRIDRELLA